VTILERLERYYDAVPRQDARAEDIGPLVLFVREIGWPYYARPRLGEERFETGNVDAVRRRQRELGQPEALEWVAETAPRLAAAARAAGLAVAEHPLMVLEGEVRTPDSPPGVLVRPATVEDAAAVDAVQQLGFAVPGTAVGDAGLDRLQERIAAVPAERGAVARELEGAGLMRRMVAVADGAVVCAGAHKPVGGVSEIVGVATLPAYRRRGLAGAVTAALAADARALGAATVFLSAGDGDVARLYGRLGFVSVGTACIAEPES
jgi:ribosomal protein S18 acetylase RimI-like enzyme